MQVAENKPALNTAQIALLQIFDKYKLNEKELTEIRVLLANYFLEKSLAKTDELWENSVVNEDSIDKLIKGK